mmetsp:Transcript_27431/g.58264  ORF Transcript_27431/g.58264 Transcript_27431/m.58264 type:complete len:97 (+) Transcript_27431:399-689(+)
MTTGESIQMCSVNPGMDFPTDDSCRNGEEFFICNGSLAMDGENYPMCGWFQFPVSISPSPKHRLLIADTEVAQVNSETGHVTEKAIAMVKIQIIHD